MCHFLNKCLVYYDAVSPADKCLAATSSQRFACLNVKYGYCLERDMHMQDLHSAETLRHVSHIMWTIVPALFFFAIARVITQLTSLSASESTFRFAVEFLIIVVPTVLCINVSNDSVEYFVAAMTVSLLLLVWCTKCCQKARERKFVLGRRPFMVTMARATISILTALCILAIDFESFPRIFRKTRRYGAGLMDVGIGLFVFSMGIVSRRPKNASELGRLFRMVTPVLVLGILRTVVIIAIDYHQDEHEYGMHLNAFFTLGLTKLFGTLVSAIATTDGQLLPLGLATLILHEIVLQMGMSNFVMDVDIKRNNFWTANREGLCSLPGFVSLYIISMYYSRWVQTKPTLNYGEFMRKLQSLAWICGGVWTMTAVSIFTVGIARVTCNFGYVAWTFGIAVTMTMLFMIVFDLIVNTLWPIDTTTITSGNAGEGECLLRSENADIQIPTLIGAVNRNGLTFFLLANVLTGGVNIFLHPEDRTDLESVVILSLYMLIATGFAYVLYRCKIRIA